MKYRAAYHKSLLEVLATATIEVPDDAADPHADAAEIARDAAAEMGAIFFTLIQERGPSPAFISEGQTQVFWTNATPTQLEGRE
jgi:hypothetical protein